MPNLKHPQKGFLDLPLHVRQCIYHYLGLTDKVIDLSSSYDEVFHPGEPQEDPWVDYLACRHCLNDVIVKREDYHPMTEYWYCHDESKGRRSLTSDADCELEHCFRDDSHFQLLFTCKTLFAEIQELVYKENRFILDRGTPTGFQSFMKLNSSSVRALTHLTIRLDGEPPETMDLSDHWTRTSTLRPLKHYSRYGKQAYKEWYALVARLRDSGIVPRQLNFFLIALVPDTKEAIFVLQPLQSLPTLKSCGIWLNHRHIPDLAAFIKETVETLTRRKAGDQIDGRVYKEKIPFRYLDLPPEIRCRILSFTDLSASPHLEWKPINSALDQIKQPQKAACDCYKFEDYLGKGGSFGGAVEEAAFKILSLLLDLMHQTIQMTNPARPTRPPITAPAMTPGLGGLGGLGPGNVLEDAAGGLELVPDVELMSDLVGVSMEDRESSDDGGSVGNADESSEDVTEADALGGPTVDVNRNIYFASARYAGTQMFLTPDLVVRSAVAVVPSLPARRYAPRHSASNSYSENILWASSISSEEACPRT
ncbi:hypothetical protein IQ07DRAFT_646316 [Pyrenochaeta sp. DS3sAY3a]|nr:hypothetical protein IQ07DRAFT_646316 [Pyrenochaeta sp. DS3sAY3a]